MTWLEFLNRKGVKDIYEWLPQYPDGAQPDRMQRHLRHFTRRDKNHQINDLYALPSVFTKELITHLVLERIKRYDVA